MAKAGWMAAAAVTAIMLASANDAFACQCVSSGPPCQDFFQVSAVFVGTVRSISPAIAQDPSSMRKVRVEFADARPIKGVQGSTASILTARDEAACGYGFKQGETYVVYAYRPKGGANLEVVMCSRTKPLAEAGDDLRFFETLSLPGGGSRLSGWINHWEEDLRTGETRTYGPVRDVLLTVRGNGGAFEARTDDQGRYDLVVPPGSYELNVFPPAGFSTRYLRKTFDLRDGHACHVADFSVRYDGRVRGSVTTSAGQPATEAVVELVPVERLGGGQAIVTPTTQIDPAGNFEFSEIPPGRYFVGVDLTRRMDAAIVFPRTFHPGTPGAALATVVELKGGERRDLAPMSLPAARRVLDLAGTVTFEDGTPVSGVFIALLDSDALNAAQVGEAMSGADGRFSLRVHEGLSYAATASHRDNASPQRRSQHVDIAPFVVTDQTKPLTIIMPRVSSIQSAPEITQQAVKQDFDALWQYISENYAYLDQKAIAWPSIPQLYASDIPRVRTRQEFVVLLEHLVEELYDHHAHLTTNTAASPRLAPSGADMWAAWQDGRATVLEVRSGSDAERAGIKAGAVVHAINGVTVDKAVDARLGRAVSRQDEGARSWALRTLLAGRRGQTRVIAFTQNQASKIVELPAREQAYPRDGRLAFRVLPDNRGYIRIHDAIGDSDLIGDFDKALAALRETSALILDLRDTPGGGNTTVARAILGRFVEREVPYQKHALPSETRDTGIARTWLELVSPRGPFRYNRPVVVLVSHWTGSMGEGLAIGFDGTGTGIIIGTPMAGLLGATYRFELPNSRIGVNVPAEQLFHVNGTPREKFVPPIAVDPLRAGADDPWIAQAHDTLSRPSQR